MLTESLRQQFTNHQNFLSLVMLLLLNLEGLMLTSSAYN